MGWADCSPAGTSASGVGWAGGSSVEAPAPARREHDFLSVLGKTIKGEGKFEQVHEGIPPMFGSSSGAEGDASGASRARLGTGSEPEPSSRARFAASSLEVALKKEG